MPPDVFAAVGDAFLFALGMMPVWSFVRDERLRTVNFPMSRTVEAFYFAAIVPAVLSFAFIVCLHAPYGMAYPSDAHRTALSTLTTVVLAWSFLAMGVAAFLDRPVRALHKTRRVLAPSRRRRS